MSRLSFRGAPLRFAGRDLRSGLAGFRIFLACLAIGVAAVAAVGSVNDALHDGLRQNARTILGGDLSTRQSYRPPPPDQLASLERLGRTTRILDMRTMVRAGGDGAERRHLLVQLKGIDSAYPLYGRLDIVGGGAVSDFLAERGGVPGALVGPTLLTRLGVDVGDTVRLGDIDVQIRGVIATEPDDLSGGLGMQMGPRLMVWSETVEAAGLIQPGTVVEYTTPVRFTDPDLDPEAARALLRRDHPEAGWRLRTPSEAGLSFQTFIDQLTQFLTLVGLLALLVGGIGVANAVKAHMDSRLRTIAVLKSVGASNADVLVMYVAQLLLIALVGVSVGLAVGALAPEIMKAAAGPGLPLPDGFRLYGAPLVQAGVFGFLVTLAFALGPLLRADLIRPAVLFRNDAEAPDPRLRLRDTVAIGAVAALLVGFIVFTATDRGLAAWFIVAALAAFALFRALAWAVTTLARTVRVPPGRAALRLGFASLRRPGGPTTAVMLSLGLGLSVLVAIALVQHSVTRQIGRGLPADAPAFFLVDVQPDQTEPLKALIEAIDPGIDVRMTDQVRGRVKAINGRPIDESRVPDKVRWVVESDRGFTTAATLPEGSTLVGGQWWPEDYDGPPLFSVTADIAEGLRLKPGDTVTVNILGRDIDGTIANTRRVDWMSLRMNFSFVTSPGAFAGAPRTWLMSINAPPDHLREIEAQVGERFANVSIVDVRSVLDRVGGILKNVALSVDATAILTLVSGLLVLAGAFAATHRRRIQEAVTLKVLGAGRWDIVRAYLVEYGLLGLSAGLVAAVLGTVAAWAMATFFLKSPFSFSIGVVMLSVLGCLAVTLIGGFVGTARALGSRAAPYLREE